MASWRAAARSAASGEEASEESGALGSATVRFWPVRVVSVRYLRLLPVVVAASAVATLAAWAGASAAGALEAFAGVVAVASASAARCMVSRLRSLSVGFLGVL